MVTPLPATCLSAVQETSAVVWSNGISRPPGLLSLVMVTATPDPAESTGASVSSGMNWYPITAAIPTPAPHISNFDFMTSSFVVHRGDARRGKKMRG